MIRNIRRVFAPLGALLVAALFLAACEGEDLAEAKALAAGVKSAICALPADSTTRREIRGLLDRSDKAVPLLQRIGLSPYCPDRPAGPARE